MREWVQWFVFVFYESPWNWKCLVSKGGCSGVAGASLLDFWWNCSLSGRSNNPSDILSPMAPACLCPGDLLCYQYLFFCFVYKRCSFRQLPSSPSGPLHHKSLHTLTQERLKMLKYQYNCVTGAVSLCSVSLSEVYGLKSNWFATVFKTRAGGYCCALLQCSSPEKTIAKAKTSTFFCDVVSSDAPSRGEVCSIFMELSAIFTKVVWTLFNPASWAVVQAMG